MNDQIIIRGARENNLKNVNVTIVEDDVPYDRPQVVDYNDCLKELNGLVGLKSIKLRREIL